jgi:hypothetical protein
MFLRAASSETVGAAAPANVDDGATTSARWVRPLAVGGYVLGAVGCAVLGAGFVFDTVSAGIVPDIGVEDAVGPAAYTAGGVLVATAVSLLVVNGALE